VTRTVPISFEALQLYAGDEAFRRKLKSGATLARRWLDAVRSMHPDGFLAVKVFIDDYSAADREVVRADIISEVREVFEHAGAPVDYIVFEKDCATTAHLLRANLVLPPRPGQGSPHYGVADWDDLESRLRFDYVSEEFDPNTEQSELRGVGIERRETRNDIGIGVRLGWRKQRDDGTEAHYWTCPAVAAWWQLIRFGALLDYDLPNVDGAPEGSWKRQHSNVPPFIAERTVTLLSPSYISVEHGVRTILQNLVELTPGVRRRLGIRRETGDADWLDRITYIFDA
jgi:hypothetical protein